MLFLLMSRLHVLFLFGLASRDLQLDLADPGRQVPEGGPVGGVGGPAGLHQLGVGGGGADVGAGQPGTLVKELNPKEESSLVERKTAL